LIFRQLKARVPKGHFENSPAFERREPKRSRKQVPQGRLKKFFQPSQRDSTFFQTCPGIKMPGFVPSEQNPLKN
jgi:hypothetical protein